MKWANDWGHVAMTNGTLMDWSNDTIQHNHEKPSNNPDWPSYAIGSNY